MNILITSAGRRSYLIKYFKEAFNSKGLVFASNSSFTIALQEADGYFISPLIYDGDYIKSIIEFCNAKNIKAIISVFDIDLLILSKSKKIFEDNGIRLILADEKTVLTCNDKWETYQFFSDNGFKTPKTFVDILLVKRALLDGNLSFPLIIKPRWGMASMSIYKAENEEELDFFYEYSKKEIFRSYLKYESEMTPENVVLIQEFIKGQEYGLDVVTDLESNYVGVFPKSKILMRAGETDLGETVSDEVFKDDAEKLSTLLKPVGILSVDCFVVENEIYFIEMNCRISGHYPLSHLAGVNLPKQILEWLQGNKTDMSNFLFKTGLYITKDLYPVILNK